MFPLMQPSITSELHSFSAATHGSVWTFTERGSTANSTGAASSPPSMRIAAGSSVVLAIATAKSNMLRTVLPVTVGKYSQPM